MKGVVFGIALGAVLASCSSEGSKPLKSETTQNGYEWVLLTEHDGCQLFDVYATYEEKGVRRRGYHVAYVSRCEPGTTSRVEWQYRSGKATYTAANETQTACRTDTECGCTDDCLEEK